MAKFITQLTPPADNKFKWLVTYIANSTFTATRAGWYRFYVIGAGGKGARGGEGGRVTKGGTHGAGAYGGGGGGSAIISAYMEAGETAQVIVGSGSTQLIISGRTVTSICGDDGSSEGEGGTSAGGDTNYTGAGSSSPTSGSTKGNVSEGGNGGGGGGAQTKYGGSGGSRGTGGYVSRDDSTNPAYFEGRAGNPGGNATAVTTGANTELGGGGGGGGGASVAYGTGYASLNGYGGGNGGSGATGGVVVENVPNSPPTTPTNPQTTGNISGQSAVTRWGASTDPDGDAITYTLEQRADGGAWAQVYQGPELQATYAVPLSGTYFQRRVKASDTYGNESGYALESEKLISYNQLPTISGTDRDLGEFQERLEFVYTVDDPDAGDVLTVTEKIDGITTKVYTATRNVPTTFDMSRWPMLTNGKHTLLIQLTDGKATVSRTVTFTRVEYRILCYQAQATTRMAEKVTLVLNPTLPTGWKGAVYVCNNGADNNPVWEDVSDYIGKEYEFTNIAKTAAEWAFGVKIDITEIGGVPVTIRAVSATVSSSLFSG